MLDTDKAFVFIGGLHRSGTSLLHRCIRDHPQVSGFSETDSPRDEGQHLQDVYRPGASFGGPGVFGFDADSYLDESSRLANKQSAKKLFSQWAEYWDLSKPIMVEKSPPNLVRMRFLQALFPKSRFVVIVRHPIAVSYATQKWTEIFKHLYRRASNPIWERVLRGLHARLPDARLPTWMLVRHWIVCHEKLRRDSKEIESLLVVRYEDLTEKPESTMEEVWKFLGVEDSDLSQEVRSGVNEKYFERWRQMRDGGLFRSLHSGYVLSAYEGKANSFGYSLEI